MTTATASASTMKVTYVGSGVSTPFNAHPTTTMPRVSSSTSTTTTTTTASTTGPHLVSASASAVASPVTASASPALQTDSARLSPYVSLVRQTSQTGRYFGPPTPHMVKRVPRASVLTSGGCGVLSGMRTAYTPVTTAAASAASFSSRMPSSSVAVTPTLAARASVTSATAGSTASPLSLAGTGQPLAMSASASSATLRPAPVVLAKPPITQFMSEHTYATLRDAAGRPVAAPPLDLVPPFRFAAVEEGVYRGAYPVLRNFPFLKALGIRTVVSLVPEDPTYDLVTFCACEGIALHHIQAERFKGETQLLPTDLNAALNIVLALETHPIYLHCLDGKQVVGLVVMGLRKLMQWDLEQAHREYLRFCSGVVEDEVAFMADYTGPLTVPHRVPAWLSALYVTDPRGVVRPRKYNCGIKLKFPAEEKATVPALSTSASAGYPAELGIAVSTEAGRALLPAAAPTAAGLVRPGGGAIEATSFALTRAAFPTATDKSAEGPDGGAGSLAPSATASAEGKLAAEETAVALSINLPWSELVDEKGVYFDVQHVGHADHSHPHPHNAQLSPSYPHHSASLGQRAATPHDGAGPDMPQSRRPFGSGSEPRHHAHAHAHAHSRDQRGASADTSAHSSPPATVAHARLPSGTTSKGSSTNTSLILPPHTVHGGPPLSNYSAPPSPPATVSGATGLSHTTSATSTPPFAPMLATTATTSHASPLDSGGMGGGGGGGAATLSDGMGPGSSAASSTAPMAGHAPSLPRVNLAYFSLGRPGGTLQPPSVPSPPTVALSAADKGLASAESPGASSQARGSSGVGGRTDAFGHATAPLPRHAQPVRAGSGSGGSGGSGGSSRGGNGTGDAPGRASGGGSGGGAGAGAPPVRTGAAPHASPSSTTAASTTRQGDGRLHAPVAEASAREAAASKTRPKRRYSL